MMALVGDIARRLAMMNQSLDNPLHGDGIVLIDEVDLHLHPKWQRSLIRQLSETFPNCQFVLTTHSPLVISDAKDVLVYVLNDGELHEHNGLYGLDANQVLLEVMDTDIRNSDVQKRLNNLLERLQDGESGSRTETLRRTGRGASGWPYRIGQSRAIAAQAGVTSCVRSSRELSRNN